MSTAYRFSLYVAGRNTPKSLRAQQNLQTICDRYIQASYVIEVIDVTIEPEKAETHRIIATPTLECSVGDFYQKIVGDLSLPEKFVDLLLSLPGQANAV